MNRLELADKILPCCEPLAVALKSGTHFGWIYDPPQIRDAVERWRAGTLADGHYQSVNKDGAAYAIDGPERIGVVPHRDGLVRVFATDLDAHEGGTDTTIHDDALARFFGAAPVRFTSKSGRGVRQILILRDPVPVDLFLSVFKSLGFNRAGRIEIFPKTSKLTQFWLPNEPNAGGGDRYLSGDFEHAVCPLPVALPCQLPNAALDFMLGFVGNGTAGHNAIFATSVLLGEKRVPREVAQPIVERAAALNGKTDPREIGKAFADGYAQGTAKAPAPSRSRTLVSVDGLDVRETDAFGAEFFVKQFGENLRYDHAMGCFLLWDGTRWNADREESTFELGIQSAIRMRGIADNMEEKRSAKFYGFARQSENRRKISDMLFLAARMPGIATTRAQLDVDPFLFNCLNGTVRLHNKTVSFQPPRREDLLTKRANVNYDPAATCPRWTAFVNWCACNDPEIVAFLARFAGVCVTGHALQFLVFPFGMGANGKSVFWNTLVRLLGDYATKASFDLLTKEKGGIPNDVAALHGTRLAVCSEIPAGARVNESLLKDLTGGDIINARFLRQEFFQFAPTHKLMIVGNHRPRIAGGTDGTWRRLVLVPFLNVVPVEQRRDLDVMVEEFLTEGGGVLNWCLDGLRDFWARGFVIPEQLRVATREYRVDEDVLADFIEMNLDRQPGAEAAGSAVYARYVAGVLGGKPMSARSLYEGLRERGFRCDHKRTGVVVSDVALKMTDPEPGWA